MPWIVLWVGMAIEAITAAGYILMEQPVIRNLIATWLNRWAVYCVQETTYLWRWAQLRYGDSLLLVDKNKFVERVMEIAETDIMDFLRLNGVAASEAAAILQELRTRVTLQFTENVMRGVIPSSAPAWPPAWPLF